MLKPNTPRSRIAAWLLTAVLLLVSAGTLAHELDHQFHKHDLPCALHLYAGHLDGAPAASLSVSFIPAGDVALPAAVTHALPRLLVRPYAARAPPLSS